MAAFGFLGGYYRWSPDNLGAMKISQCYLSGGMIRFRG